MLSIIVKKMNKRCIKDESSIKDNASFVDFKYFTIVDVFVLIQSLAWMNLKQIIKAKAGGLAAGVHLFLLS